MSENTKFKQSMILFVLLIASIFGLVIVINSVKKPKSTEIEYLLPSNYETIVSDSNKLYEAIDSDSGGVTVYYKQGLWATYRNGSMYSLQQYLLPKNRAGSIYDEVKDIPTFNESNVTYMGYDASTGDVLTLDKNMSFIEINSTYNGSVSVYIEWQDGDYYYSYVMQYGDVSILYTHTDEINLFRGYTAYLNAKYSEEATEGNTENNIETSVSETMTEGSVTDTAENTTETSVSETMTESSATDTSENDIETSGVVSDTVSEGQPEEGTTSISE